MLFSANSIPRIFQSTPSVWRETHKYYYYTCYKGISIHSLRVEGDETGDRGSVESVISIHSLRVEGDVGIDFKFVRFDISIHSLHVEGDM